SKNRAMAPAQYAQLFVQARDNFSARLSALAKQNPTYADAVLQYLLGNGSEREVMDALQTRGISLPVPWTRSYRALAGLYFLSGEPQISESFDSILGARTVG